MCSIIGYYGSGKAAPIMVSGLKRMEYRGYDSVGIATKVENAVQIRKGVGRVDEVNKAENLDGLEGTVGIGHTRWATHGKVTRSNAHPHASNTSMVAIVHNGIIENFTELKSNLQLEGFTFESDTDTHTHNCKSIAINYQEMSILNIYCIICLSTNPSTSLAIWYESCTNTYNQRFMISCRS